MEAALGITYRDFPDQLSWITFLSLQVSKLVTERSEGLNISFDRNNSYFILQKLNFVSGITCQGASQCTRPHYDGGNGFEKSEASTTSMTSTYAPLTFQCEVFKLLQLQWIPFRKWLFTNILSNVLCLGLPIIMLRMRLRLRKLWILWIKHLFIRTKIEITNSSQWLLVLVNHEKVHWALSESIDRYIPLLGGGLKLNGVPVFSHWSTLVSTLSSLISSSFQFRLTFGNFKWITFHYVIIISFSTIF